MHGTSEWIRDASRHTDPEFLIQWNLEATGDSSDTKAIRLPDFGSIQHRSLKESAATGIGELKIFGLTKIDGITL